MRIAFISYEFAGIAISGGIGTYVRNASQMLARRGHSVEVFTSGLEVCSFEVEGNLTVHTVVSSREDFAKRIVPTFRMRHRERSFEVIEGAEFGACASEVAEVFPSLPLVVKLHGPSFTIWESNAHYVSSFAKARFVAGALRRGRFPTNPWHYDPSTDKERAHAFRADWIVANSKAMAKRAICAWGMPHDRISSVPLVFYPSPALTKLEPKVSCKTVFFLGRLEVRKGVIELARAIPMVLKRDPEVCFRFIGRSLPHPTDGRPILDHIKKIIGSCVANVEFVDGVPYSAVPNEMKAGDVAVFPSHWEASGYVCMEAMAAARCVIGSSAGGMAEIIDHGRTGLLVPPCNPRAIADAILQLLADPDRRIAMGLAARTHVLSAYSPDVIAPLQEASYLRAIKNARSG